MVKGQGRSVRDRNRQKEVSQMKMSDVIADFIGEMLSDGGGVAALARASARLALFLRATTSTRSTQTLV